MYVAEEGGEEVGAHELGEGREQECGMIGTMDGVQALHQGVLKVCVCVCVCVFVLVCLCVSLSLSLSLFVSVCVLRTRAPPSHTPIPIPIPISRTLIPMLTLHSNPAQPSVQWQRTPTPDNASPSSPSLGSRFRGQDLGFQMWG